MSECQRYAIRRIQAIWAEGHRPNRACDLCSRGVDVGHNRHCRPNLERPGCTVPVSKARSSGGHCGPEAAHLDIPSHRLPQWRATTHSVAAYQSGAWNGQETGGPK